MAAQLVSAPDEYKPTVRSWLIVIGCDLNNALIEAGVADDEARRGVVRQHLTRLAGSLDGATESYAWSGDSIVVARLAFVEKLAEARRMFVSDAPALRDEVEFVVRTVFSPPEWQPERG